MENGEPGDGPREEEPLQGSPELHLGTGMAAAVETPEPPGQPPGIVSGGVEEKERAGRHAPDLREGGEKRVVVEVVRDRRAEDEVERPVDEGKARGIALNGEIEGPAAPAVGERKEIDVEADRADAEAEADLSAGAPDVEDASRRQGTDGIADPFDHAVPAGRDLHEVVDERPGEERGRGSPEEALLAQRGPVSATANP